MPPPRLCVFSIADEPRAHRVLVVWPNLFLKVGHIEQAESAVDGAARHAAERCRTAGFPQVNVAGRFEKDFILRPAMNANRDLVRHSAGGHEQPGFLAEKCRDATLQLVDRRVFAEDIIADTAAAMAASIPGVGFVTVSLRRSIMKVHCSRRGTMSYCFFSSGPSSVLPPGGSPGTSGRQAS